MSFSSFTIRRALPPVLYAHNAATTRRTMATNRPKEWLCIMPDKPNVTSLRKATMEYVNVNINGVFASLALYTY